jgi:molecular chaperone GrpE (heat shock protein)
MSIAQLFKSPNQLTRSENRQIEDAVAGLNAEFENLRQRLKGQAEKADVDGAEYLALLMANTMSQIAIMQGAQRGDPKVVSSMRKKGFLKLPHGCV